MVQSFQPRDMIDLVLTGQFIAMNELFADNSRDILHGMPAPLKQRARSSAIAMGRLALAQVSEFERRGIQPYRAETVAEQCPAAAAVANADVPAETPEPAGSTPAPVPAIEPQPTDPVAAPPAGETSWVDEPYQEWLEATPAILAAGSTTVSVDAIPPPVSQEGDGSADLESPCRSSEHQDAEAMGAAAD